MFSLRSPLNCKSCPTGEQVKPPTLGVHHQHVPSNTLCGTWHKICAQQMQAIPCSFPRIYPWLQYQWDAAYIRLKLPRNRADFNGSRKAIAMNKLKKICQYSVLSRQPKGAKTHQGQSPFGGLIKRLRLWDIRQTNEVWWSERVTMAPQRSRPRMSRLMPPDHRIYSGSSCVIFLLPHSS